jgi:spectinomycin phosphotransferase
MLEQPELLEERILVCLDVGYRIFPTQLIFLPLGADQNTVVYQAMIEVGKSYFIKLRRDNFKPVSVLLPEFLSNQGISAIIPPVKTVTGQLWVDLNPYHLIVYPFIVGHNGYETMLADSHWVEFGAVLRKIHGSLLPPELKKIIPQRSWSADWRKKLLAFLEISEVEVYSDPIARELAVLLQGKRGEITDLITRAEKYSQIFQSRSPDLVLCHSDLHAGNILISLSGELFIVDWDDPILAPKERDLMYAGGGQFGNGRTPPEEEGLFYQGYGPVQPDPVGLVYYRYQRIIEDLAIFSEQLLTTREGGKDREQSLQYFKSNFLPGGTIEIANCAEIAQVDQAIRA